MTRRIAPGPGQESVWDYPRPPRIDVCSEHIRVVFAGITIADSTHSVRVLETSHPPVYYFPPDDVRMQHLVRGVQQSFCEWKGSAGYYSIVIGERRSENAAWCYPAPARGFEAIRNYLAFYPSRVDGCFVDDERVTPQPGDFYGGWITSKIVGSFKGAPGSWGW
jgi:uncharacterized protein (DUF427 family)